MSELVAGLTVLAASGLAFVAYNHPRQFQWFTYIYLGAWALAFAVAFISYRSYLMFVEQLRNAPLPDDHKQIAIQSLLNFPASPTADLVSNIAWYGMYYIVALSFLPSFGLTADSKATRRGA